MRKPWQFEIILTRSGQGYTVNSLTSYHVIISDASTQKKGLTTAGLKPLVMSPKTSQPLEVKMASIPVLIYVNDYGVYMPPIFRCKGNTYKMDENRNSRS